jgi:hypothetical protein
MANPLIITSEHAGQRIRMQATHALNSAGEKEQIGGEYQVPR